MKIQDGLNDEIIDEISDLKGDPEWMRQFRHDCLKTYHELSTPNWGPYLSGLDLAHISNYVRSSDAMVSDWNEVPGDIRNVFEQLGIPESEKGDLAGLGAQYDSELVYHRVKEEAAKRGVVYLGIEEAMKSPEYSQLFREHFMKLVPPSDHKFAALHGAVWSGGSFVFIPAGVSAEFPLQSYYRFNAPGAGQFEHTLIILEEGAELHFIEGCSAPKYNVANLHAGCVEIFVGKNASIKYSTVESWSKNMYNLNTKRAYVEEGGKIEWVTGSFGSKVSMLYPMAILAGRGASMEYTGVSLAGEGQDLDTGVKVLHQAPETRSLINSKSISKSGGKNTFRSLVKVLSGAKNARSFTDCASLMVDENSHNYTIPNFDIREDSASVAHEASVGKISEKELEYLCSRGMSEDAARGLIVRGFANDISKELPVEYAIEMNNYLKLSMEGNL